MDDKAELEERLKDHFRRQHRSWMNDIAQEKIYDSVVSHIYGPGARDPMLAIRWSKLYGENECPSCQHLITLEADRYVCKNCGFTIDLKTYDEAAREYETRKNLLAEDRKLMQEANAKGVKPLTIDKLYETAREEVEREVDE